jgi:oxidoreductase
VSAGAGGDTCLLTGATGFIGSHIARRLASEGHRLRCLVRTTSDTSMLEHLGVELVIGDLTDASSLGAAADGCRCVFHCGALVSDWATVEEIKRINVEGTRDLLGASVSASVKRFVHLSTTDVYGYPGTAGVDEDYAAAGFSNWYSETKRAAEGEVGRAARAHALEAVVLRIATVYGPGSKEVIGEMARAMKARHMLLIDRGRPIAGLTYVENVVDAAVLALRSPAAAGQAFNVSDGLDVTWQRFLGDLAEGLGYPPPRLSMPYGVAYGIGYALEHGYRLVRSLTGVTSPPLLSRQAVQVLGRNQDFSNRKARELLGWEPRVGYAAGLDATVRWLREEYLL